MSTNAQITKNIAEEVNFQKFRDNAAFLINALNEQLGTDISLKTKDIQQSEGFAAKIAQNHSNNNRSH